MNRILIIEDEPSIADALQFVLQGEGLLVELAPTLGHARSLLKSQTFDLLVLDVGLPDGNGFDFCKELRKSNQVPVLFLTARQSEVDRIIGLEIGGDDYVTKPFSSREVTARIKAIFRRLEIGSATKSHTGGIRIDLERACVFVHDQKVELTRNELYLLQHLQSHPGKVFSRNQLMEAVWQVPGSATERTVDAHIKTLRKKVPQAPIDTHRGFGYSWNPDAPKEE